jgi:hypothetical protein
VQPPGVHRRGPGVAPGPWTEPPRVQTQGSSEHHWRHHHGATDWYPENTRLPGWPELQQPAPPHPVEVAELYRALRKGREDSKDEPGAADFYYGETELRRHARRLDARQARKDSAFGRWIASATEHAILTVYWLVSGYALRAWRALATLSIVVLVAAGIFALWGFAPSDQPRIRPVAVDARGAPIYARQPVERPAGLDELPTAVRFSAQAATALLRGPDRPLTALGEWLHMALRLGHVSRIVAGLVRSGPQPDQDVRHGDGGLVADGKLVEAGRHRPELLAPVHQPLDLVALAVALAVKGRRPTPARPPAGPVGLLIIPLRDRVPDVAGAQRRPVGPTAVGLVAGQMGHPSAGPPPPTRAGHPHGIHQPDQLAGVGVLARSETGNQVPAATVTDGVQLGGQPAP